MKTVFGRSFLALISVQMSLDCNSSSLSPSPPNISFSFNSSILRLFSSSSSPDLSFPSFHPPLSFSALPFLPFTYQYPSLRYSLFQYINTSPLHLSSPVAANIRNPHPLIHNTFFLPFADTIFNSSPQILLLLAAAWLKPQPWTR